MANQNLENRVGTINDYFRAYEMSKALKEDPSNYGAIEALGHIKQGDPTFYSGQGPDIIKSASDEEKERSEKQLVKDISYDDIISRYSNNQLKGALEKLPTLKKGNEELKKAHESFYKALHGYEDGIKLMNKDPEAFRQLAINSAGTSRADAYYAGASTENARRIYAGGMLEAQRQLYATIDKIKPSTKKK